jgi:hypothetical protein
MGPRHLAPAIPFLCLGLAPLWTRSSRAVRLVLAALWLWGFSLSLITVSTMAQPAAAIRRPVAELVWPAFRDGDLALNTQTFDAARANRARWRTGEDPKAAWNLGMKLGLSGWPSLLPLVLAWLALAWHIGRTLGAGRAFQIDRTRKWAGRAPYRQRIDGTHPETLNSRVRYRSFINAEEAGFHRGMVH